jgi:hypothetical protein
LIGLELRVLARQGAAESSTGGMATVRREAAAKVIQACWRGLHGRIALSKMWATAAFAAKLSLGLDDAIHYEVDPVTEEREEITIAEIAQLYNAGSVTGETLVWAEGMEDWLT